MPQEHYVLKCFSCETFQVHIVKKSKKWECKICGSKQSLKRNYGKGSGKDCRVQVMRLNELRLKKDRSVNQLEGDQFYGIGSDDKHMNDYPKEEKPQMSKWVEYLEENIADQRSEDDNEEDDLNDFLLKSDEKKKKRVKRMAENCSFKKRKISGKFFIEEKLAKNCEDSRDVLLNPSNQSFDVSIKKKEAVKTNPPVQSRNESKPSKYSKYLEDQENENDTGIKKGLNIFDADSTDLENILNFS